MKRFLLVTVASVIAATSLAVPAFAAATPKVTVDPACMATAVAARDVSISTALGAVVTAINTRGQALSAAWTNNTDPKARRAAVKAANDAFKGTWTTFAAARKAAWGTYATAAKACHVTSSDAAAPSTAAGSM